MCLASLRELLSACPFCSVMSTVVESTLLSGSKLRRMRSVATKQRLFQSAQKDERWCMVHSQLALLTSSVDCILQLLTASTTFGYPCNQQSLNPTAPEFVPAEGERGIIAQTEETDEKEEVAQPSALSGDARSFAVHCNCASCWEPLPCFCGRATICKFCAMQRHAQAKYNALTSVSGSSAINVLSHGSVQ